jgi:hypothetical protein
MIYDFVESIEMSVENLYKNYIEKYGERSELFNLLKNKFNIIRALYPGSALHITPSFFFPETVYIDTYSKAKSFFKMNGLNSFIARNKRYEPEPIVRYYPSDYKDKISEKDNYFDLLISQYAGFISKYCKRYLKLGGFLVVNNSHGDASMASIDNNFEFFAVLNLRNRKYYYSQKNLEQYFIPKKSILITEEYLERRQRGVGYKKTATNYLFKRVN